MGRIELLNGDCLDVLATLPDCMAQTCITSPPYYGLRDYGVSGQIGLEPTPDEYVARLVAVFRQVRRVLRDDGTLWLNLGDSYASSNGFKKSQPQQSRNGQQGVVGDRFKHPSASRSNIAAYKDFGDCKPKDIIGIPWRVAFALQADGWYLRQDIIWHKPNPMPESVTDRCTKAHEYIFLLSKRARYFYDADAISEPFADERMGCPGGGNRNYAAKNRRDGTDSKFLKWKGNAVLGRNRRSVWTCATKPYSEAHFATFPPDLIRPCVSAGSKPGDVVLDPFNGAGTSGLVSLELGRRYVGIELNPEYIELTRRRLAGLQPVLV